MKCKDCIYYKEWEGKAVRKCYKAKCTIKDTKTDNNGLRLRGTQACSMFKAK